ncbi:MAG: tetratricopeptide repeat protein, partial [Candidatus Binatia bacterium]
VLVKSTHKKSKGGKGPRPVQVSAIANGTKLAPTRWLVPVIVALLTGVAFLPALQNGFVDFDDKVNFLSNPHYRGLGLDELRWMFTPFWGHYTPLTWLTLGLDYLLWGMDPAGYHLTNVLLHVATAVAFYFLTIQLLRLATGSGGEDKALWAGAAFAALFFAVHPLRVESVAWITERRDVLSGLFYVLTILAYLRAVDRVGQGARWYWVSVVLFACALLSKAMAISLPVVLLILDVYPLRRLGGPVGWWSASARHVYTEKIPFVLLAGVASAVALAALFHTLGTSSSMDWVSPLDRLSISGYGLGFYLWKTVAPLTLSPLYELPIKINPWSPTFIWNYILVLIFIVATFALRHRLPGLLAAWLAYVVILLPVIGIVQNGDHIAADRYTYLACLGWAIMAGAGIFYCWRLWVRRRIGLRTFVFINGVAVMVVVGLGGLTWKQTQIWHNSERLWRHAVSAGPESKKAHYNLGNALLKRGELGEAIKHYREVLRIYPASADVHNNLGNAMFNRGELGKAIKHYRQALRINPAYAKAHNNLAVALLNEGKLTEATEHFCQSVRLGYAQAQKNLTIALTRLGEREDAVKRCRKP